MRFDAIRRIRTRPRAREADAPMSRRERARRDRSLARARGDARRRPWGDARRRAMRWRRARLNHPSRPDDDDERRRRRRRERRERRARCTLRASTRPRSRSTTMRTTIVIGMISARSGRRRGRAARRIRPGSRRFRPCSRRSPMTSFARFDARRRRRGRPIPWRRFEGSRGTGAASGWPPSGAEARGGRRETVEAEEAMEIAREGDGESDAMETGDSPRRDVGPRTKDDAEDADDGVSGC